MAFVKYAARQGHGTTVICSDRASWHDRRDETLVKNIPSNTKIIRISSTFKRDLLARLDNAKKKSRSRALTWAITAAHWRINSYWPDEAIIWGIKAAYTSLLHAARHRPDCIITSGPQHLSHISGYITKAVLKTPWIMDYRDPWTGLEGAGQVAPGPYQERLFHILEKFLLRHADLITVVSPSWVDHLTTLAPTSKKIELIRNGHDLHEELITKRTGIKKPRPGTLTIHFNGTIQHGSNILDDLYNGVGILLESGILNEHPIEFTFCGLPQDFKNRILNTPAETIFIDYGVLPHEASIERSIEADAVMITVRDEGDVCHGTIPGKTYEAMALGLYIFGILPAKNDARSLLEDYGNATITKSTTSEHIAEALRKLLILKETCPELPHIDEAIRTKIAKDQSRSNQATQLFDLVNSCLGKH